ncbi:MAG: DUF3857 domain-containing protein [Thermoguttaceae bacterium]
MRRSLPACIVGMLFSCGFLAALSAADEPWEAAAFSARADDVRRAAAALAAPKDADIDVLLEEVHYTFDLQGRRQCVTRQVMRFLTPKGVSECASVEGVWTPWCEDRPQLRARVIASDGAVHELDLRSVGEAPVEQEPNVWSDRKILRAPLPAVRPGTVAETEVVLREVQPYFAQGVVKHFALALFYPVRKLRLIIDYPAQLPLRYEVRGTEVKPLRTEKDGQARLVFETRPDKPLKLQDIEMFTPPEVPLFPEVVFSTGKSWNDVAVGYEALVEQQMDLEAVRALARETVGQGASREQAAARLLAKVQQIVRYTGVEFGNAAIVPRSPREILVRRYGDCKDQAILLVAMLRSAGFPAFVALVRSGSHADIAKDLPGLGEFNHAIVCVAGKPDLWLDPTDNYVPAGQLPLADQGRWTLIASHFVVAPVKTSVVDYRQNRNTKIVDYFLCDGTNCRVRETLVAEGSCGEQLRSYIASQNEEDLRKRWQEYVCTKYRASALLSFEHGSPQDLSKPFRIVAEAADAKICAAVDDTLSASLLPGSLFLKLPYPLLPEVSGTSEGSSFVGESSPKDRKAPLLLPEPHVCDLVIHLTPPPGFIPGPLPASEVKQFGPMTFSRRFEAVGDAVTATFRLDTGAGTLTAAEVNALRHVLCELGPKGNLSRWVVPVEFEYRGAKQLREGHWKEAFDEYRRLDQQYAKRPGPRWHYANALLKAGFGDTARQLARQAVEMEPKSAQAYARLGRVLSHDLLGRHLQPGMDRPAALAAFRKAIELDPSDSILRTECAILLEHDDAGRRYSTDADLAAAIEQYREARKLAGSLGQCELNLPLDMFFVGDYAGVEKLCGESAAFPWRGLLVANEAARHGAEAAQRKVQQITQNAEEHRAALLYASDHLNRSRLYPQSLALLRMAMSKETDEPSLRALADALSRMRRFEEVQFPVNDPRYVVQQALVAALAGGKWEERFLDLYATTSTAADKTASLGSIRTIFRETIRAGRTNRFPPQRVADAASLFEVAVNGGDDASRRIQVTNPKIPTLNLVWYVIREPKGYRILAAGSGAANLGSEALRQLAANHLETAVRWLDWAWKDKPRPSLFASFSASPFAQFWQLADRSRPESVRIAGAALAAEGMDPASAIPILLSAKSNTETASQKLQIDRALAMAYCRLRRWPDLMEIVSRLQGDYAKQPSVVLFKMAALDGLNRQEELRQLVRTQLEILASKPVEQEAFAGLACESGAFGLAQDILRSRAIHGKISSVSLNELAYGAVYQEPLATDAISDALDADRRTDRGALLYPITRALLYAEQGKTNEARENLLRSLDGQSAPPGDAEWYVLGRIAEEFSLNDIAVTMYGKVSPPKSPNERTIFRLAQRRLNKQGKPEGHTPKEAEELIPTIPVRRSVPYHSTIQQ